MKGKTLKRVDLRLTGIHCPDCARSLTASMLQSLEGVSEARFDDRTNLLTVEYDSTDLREKTIRDFIAKFGYGMVETEGEESSLRNGILNNLLIVLAIIIILLLIWWVNRL